MKQFYRLASALFFLAINGALQSWEFSNTALCRGEMPGGQTEIFTRRAGKDFALFFAVQDYDEWPDLRNPIADAEALARDLRDLYGFETEVIRNPTRIEIYQKIEEYREKPYETDAQLLVFFSGHGDFRENSKEGYFIPREGKSGDEFGDSYLAHTVLERRITTLPCRHILLAVDACYSGTFAREIALLRGPVDDGRPGTPEAHRQALLNKRLQYQSRLYLTSGGAERTPDPSAFAEQFKLALRTGYEGDGMLTFSELCSFVEKAAPRPRAGQFTGHEPGGDFVFLTAGEQPRVGQESETRRRDRDAWTQAEKIGTMEAYEQYKRDHPKGVFVQEAQWRMDELVDWDIARRKNTASEYRIFLQKYSAGRFAPEARAFLNASQRMQPRPSTTKPLAEAAKKLLGVEYFVPIDGGLFTMGCDAPRASDCAPSELPHHRVAVKDFFLARQEVTQQLWRTVMGADPPNLHFKGCDQCPVESVSWNEVQRFIQKLNEKTGESFRLPTEAEWEYAARGGANSLGYPYAGSTEADEVAWYAQEQPAVVRSNRKPNELRLYDLSGNVAEWVQDCWHPDYRDAPTDGTAWMDTAPCAAHVIRGGSWQDEAHGCRIGRRQMNYARNGIFTVGFRLARDR